MTSRQRAYLKGLASTMEPVFQIGKAGLTPEVTAAISEAFNNRELLKVSILKNCPDDLRSAAATIAARTGSQVVHVIGRRIILYKENKDHKKIFLPL